MSWEEIYERTEAYLSGKLDVQESAAFEKACQEDESFAQEVQLYLKSIQEIQFEGREKLRADLKERFKNPELAIRGKKPMILPWMYAAAAAIALILLAVWVWQPGNEQGLEIEKLYSMSMEEVLVSQFRSIEGDTRSAQWEGVLGLIQDSAYEEVIPMIDRLMQDSSFAESLGGRARLYQGYAYMHLEKFEAAIQSFDLVREENPYADQIQWYKTLCLLKLGEIMQAKDFLEKIADDPQHYKRIEAASLLNKLSN